MTTIPQRYRQTDDLLLQYRAMHIVHRTGKTVPQPIRHVTLHTCFETQCVMALQGHPRSLILAPIESAYATFYWSSIVTLVLSCPV